MKKQTAITSQSPVGPGTTQTEKTFQKILKTLNTYQKTRAETGKKRKLYK